MDGRLLWRGLPGFPCLESSCKSNSASNTWNKLRLEIKDGEYIEISPDCKNVEIQLYQAKNTIRCDATVTGLPQERVKDTIEIKALYSYFLDQEIMITVHGSIE